MDNPKKFLGQHWLFDTKTLNDVVSAGEVGNKDTVLEIGPGPGSLTQILLAKAKKVVAVEKDDQLAKTLARTVLASNFEIINEDILSYDLSRLPKGYKVVANIPYYLTSNLLRRLLEDANPPSLMALMIQKEVAERIVARPPQMSLLAISVQYYAEPKLIRVVPKEMFKPPPKVDSAIIQIKLRPEPLFEADRQKLFRILKAGFAGKRKQLKNSLSAGLYISPSDCSLVLQNIGISPMARAQELSLTDWQKIYEAFI